MSAVYLSSGVVDWSCVSGLSGQAVEAKMRSSFLSRTDRRMTFAPYYVGRDVACFRRVSTAMLYNEDSMTTTDIYDIEQDDDYFDDPEDDSMSPRIDGKRHCTLTSSDSVQREHKTLVRSASSVPTVGPRVEPEEERDHLPTDDSVNKHARVKRSVSAGSSATNGAAQCPSSMKDKTCHVCGDKALGYNFNAISCESCKAFFRRNAFKEIRGRCEGKCEVTVESRSYCKRCRLQKCFTVGMKRELILSDQQKQVRCRKIRENRIRRQGGDETSNDVISQTQSSSSQESSNKMPVDSTCSPTMAVNVPPSAVTHVIASAVNPNVIDGLPESSRVLIQEIIHAFQITFDNSMERQPTATPSNVEFLNMADTSVRRLVKMAKHLSHFRSLDQEDQILLLKGAVVEVLVLRSSKMFNPETMAWQVNKEGQDHSVSAMSFKMGSPESMAFILQYRRFVGSLLRATCGDNVILMLLIVMTVFAPDRAGQSSISHVCRIQEEYANVLRVYIESRFPNDTLMIARILQRLCDIRDLNEKHTSMLMNMKVEDLEPLIIEIFDL